MMIELHILQNFAPANLNRDDTGAPKDCDFGGYRRARVSSQCLKRSVRRYFEDEKLAGDQKTTRTKRLVGEVAARLQTLRAVDDEKARAAARALVAAAGLKVAEKKSDEDEDKTEYLLFLPLRSLDSLASLAHAKWADLEPVLSAAAEAEPAPATDPKDAKRTKAADRKKEKKDAKAALPPELAKEVAAIFADARRAPGLALFGRMIADKPDWNVNAACQVAHAISTNRVSMEFDYFTAIDDLKPNDTAASDMIGTVQFNSSCFYRYSVLDVGRLGESLGDAALIRDTVARFVQATIAAVPTGKQNSMAAQNPPSFVMAVLRDGRSPVSLTNAFVQPVRPMGDTDLVTGSIQKLAKHWGKVGDVYGDTPKFATWQDRDLELAELKPGVQANTVGQLVTWVADQVAGQAP
jgi:CRISPR system Cascade subunit CasC